MPSHAAKASRAPSTPKGSLPDIARLFNFAVLVGALSTFSDRRSRPISRLADAQIRQELVTATEMRAAATTQLAEIERS